MKKSLLELELSLPAINLLNTRKIVGGYMDDTDGRPPGWDIEQGIIDFPPPQPEQPDEFEQPELPPALGGEITVEWDGVDFDDPGIDPYNPGGDDSDGGQGERDEEDSDRPDNPSDDIDRPEDQEDERDDGQNDGPPSNPNPEPDPSTPLDALRDQLSKIGIDLDRFTIKIGGVASMAGITPDGEIHLNDKLFDQDIRDQVAIVWHEVYHYDNRHHEVELDEAKLDEPIRLEFTDDQIEVLLENNRLDYSDGLDQNTRDMLDQMFLDDFLNVDEIGSPEKYEHELETYRAEKEQFPDVSDFYNDFRDTMIDYYEQLLDIANEHYNK